MCDSGRATAPAFNQLVTKKRLRASSVPANVWIDAPGPLLPSNVVPQTFADAFVCMNSHKPDAMLGEVCESPHIRHVGLRKLRPIQNPT